MKKRKKMARAQHSLKKSVVAVRLGTEGNYASTAPTEESRIIDIDLGLTLLPGSQIYDDAVNEEGAIAPDVVLQNGEELEGSGLRRSSRLARRGDRNFPSCFTARARDRVSTPNQPPIIRPSISDRAEFSTDNTNPTSSATTSSTSTSSFTSPILDLSSCNSNLRLQVFKLSSQLATSSKAALRSPQPVDFARMDFIDWDSVYINEPDDFLEGWDWPVGTFETANSEAKYPEDSTTSEDDRTEEARAIFGGHQATDTSADGNDQHTIVNNSNSVTAHEDGSSTMSTNGAVKTSTFPDNQWMSGTPGTSDIEYIIVNDNNEPETHADAAFNVETNGPAKISATSDYQYAVDTPATPTRQYTTDTSATPVPQYTSDTAATPVRQNTTDIAATPTRQNTTDTAATPTRQYTTDTPATPSHQNTTDNAATPTRQYTTDTPATSVRQYIVIDDSNDTLSNQQTEANIQNDEPMPMSTTFDNQHVIATPAEVYDQYHPVDNNYNTTTNGYANPPIPTGEPMQPSSDFDNQYSIATSENSYNQHTMVEGSNYTTTHGLAGSIDQPDGRSVSQMSFLPSNQFISYHNPGFAENSVAPDANMFSPANLMKLVQKQKGMLDDRTIEMDRYKADNALWKAKSDQYSAMNKQFGAENQQYEAENEFLRAQNAGLENQIVDIKTQFGSYRAQCGKFLEEAKAVSKPTTYHTHDQLNAASPTQDEVAILKDHLLATRNVVYQATAVAKRYKNEVVRLKSERQAFTAVNDQVKRSQGTIAQLTKERDDWKTMAEGWAQMAKTPSQIPSSSVKDLLAAYAPTMASFTPSEFQVEQPNFVQQTQPNYAQQVQPSHAQQVQANHAQQVQGNHARQVQGNHAQRVQANYAQQGQVNHAQQGHAQQVHAQQVHAQQVHAQQVHTQQVHANQAQQLQANQAQQPSANHTQQIQTNYVQQVQQVQHDQPNHAQQLQNNHAQQLQNNHAQQVQTNHVQQVQPDHAQNVQPSHTEHAMTTAAKAARGGKPSGWWLDPKAHEATTQSQMVQRQLKLEIKKLSAAAKLQERAKKADATDKVARAAQKKAAKQRMKDGKARAALAQVQNDKVDDVVDLDVGVNGPGVGVNNLGADDLGDAMEYAFAQMDAGNDSSKEWTDGNSLRLMAAMKADLANDEAIAAAAAHAAAANEDATMQDHDDLDSLFEE
ncbi:hypothetical protein MMC11_006677 [Xylographa trunciseda]|nr:hypothetical protein [Xylographa trunciseda]